MNERSYYVHSLCREKALRGDVQLMMVREASFHAEMLVMGAFRALRQRSAIQVVREEPKPSKLGLAVPQAKPRSRNLDKRR